MKISIKKYLPEILCTIIFFLLFASYSTKCYVKIFPGYFILQSCALLFLPFSLFVYFFHYKSLAPPLKLLLVFSGWCILSLLWTEELWIAHDGIRRLFTFVFLSLGSYFLFLLFPKLKKKIWNILVSVLVFFAIFYCILLFRLHFSVRGRFGFPFSNPNIAGAILGFCSVYVFVKLLYAFKGKQYKLVPFYALVFIIFFIAMVLAGGKGALLSACFLYCSILFLLFPKLRYGFLILVLVLVVLSFIYRENIIDKGWKSIEVRSYIWKGTVHMALDSFGRFFFGWGSGNFFPNFPHFQDPLIFACYHNAPLVHFPHNYLLEVLVEYGFIGLLFFLFFLFTLFYFARTFFLTHTEMSITIASVSFSILMLLLHSLVSVSLSYAIIQMFLALFIGWISSFFPFRSEKKKDKRRKLLSGGIIVLSCFFSIFLWKYYSYDSLMFQLDYKAFLKSRGETKVERGLAIKPPVCENLYTLHWRSTLANLLCDYYDKHPELVNKSKYIFVDLKNYMPKYGNSMLSRAILAAKQGNKELTEKYFIDFAKINPFFPYLWLYWGVACKNGDANRDVMEKQAQKYVKKYPFDGAPYLGFAFAKILRGEKEQAKKMLYQIILWARARLKRSHDYRTDTIRKLAESYLKR